MTKLKNLKARLLKDPEVRKHYDSHGGGVRADGCGGEGACALGIEPGRTCQAYAQHADTDHKAIMWAR